MTKNKPCTICNAKIEWLCFQELLKTTLDNSIPLKIDEDMHVHITCAVERFNHGIHQVIWSATSSSNSKIHIEYLLVIKEKIAKESKLRKLWQTNR